MRYLLLVLILLFNLNTFSQEICNNGVDDDGDGFTDLLDSQCTCNTTINTSLISNFQFEDYTSCPNGSAQLYKAFPWSQGNFGTPNYINTCGFMLSDLENHEDLLIFPSGSGIVGALMSTPYNQYIKTSLTTPIPAGNQCQLKLKIAALIHKNHPGDYDMEVSNLTPVNFTIYGSSTQSNFPVVTFTSPIIENSPWIEIGNAVYDPSANWTDLTINFTTTIEIKEIMLGAPQILPEEYYVPLMTIGSFPYFIYDDIILNKLSDFEMYINRTGNLCSNDLILTANLNAEANGNVVYQWFKGELPIYFNGNSATYNVSNSLFLDKNGDYTVIAFDNTNCYTSTITINSVVQSPSIEITPPTCLSLGSILVTSPANEYSIDNGATWSSNPFFENLLPGGYYVLTRSDNCTSNLRIAIMPDQPSNLPNPVVTINQPDSCDDIGSIIINTASDLYSFDNGMTWTTNNSILNTSPGVYYILTKDLRGCESLPVEIILVSFTNNNSPPLGDNNQYFCISENATIASISAIGTNIQWYDSIIGGNLLPINTVLQDGQSYYGTQTVNNCESPTRLEVIAYIVTTLNANNYTHTICDEDNDGVENINLEDYNSNITTSTSYHFHYYNSLNGAENEIPSDEILNFENYQLSIGNKIIYVRVSNQSSCYNIVELNLILVTKPLININDVIYICEGNNITIDAGVGFDNYLWSTNQTSQSISVNQPGSYSVVVSENYDTTACSNTKTFTVIDSNIATISQVITSDWNHNENTITVIVTSESIGDYEYSLDGINYQSSNTFSGLVGGEYMVFVRDKNGCGITNSTIYLLMFPKYFTPNGDGFNDTWKIKFSELEEDLKIQIYDRYGKLLKTLNSHEAWDGNYNGSQLPSDDYWFLISNSDGKTHNGHFALKR